MQIHYSGSHIKQAIEYFFERNQVVELRALQVDNKSNRIDSGYFNDHNELLNAAANLSSKAAGVYFTLNPVHPDLLARSENRITKWAKHTTSDADIVSRKWLMVDFDPRRRAGISATAVEKVLAIRKARDVFEFLRSQGWPDPIFADSGNGAHLDYKIDLANDDGARDLLRNVLNALGERFTDETVQIDESTFNSGRICKIYGTLSAKGSNTKERPHRLSKILKVPKEINIVPLELLQALALDVKQQNQTPIEEADHGKVSNFDLKNWLSKCNVAFTEKIDGRGTHYEIVCPFSSDHKAAILQESSGKIGFHCFHTSSGCNHKHWKDVRALFEPGYAKAAEQVPPQVDKGRSKKKEAASEPKKTAAATMLDLCQDIILFHDGDRAFATIWINDHFENHALGSRAFKNLLQHRFYTTTGKTITSQSLNEVIGTLGGKARFESPECRTFVRTAEHQGKIYVDLANEDWEAVETDGDGSRIVKQVPVKFIRSRGMSALPQPAAKGNLKLIHRVCNLRKSESKIDEQLGEESLLEAFLVASLNPNGPYPILVLHGEHGTGKSTTARMIKAVVDPVSAAALRGEPKEQRDVMISAQANHLVCYDNLSKIPDWLSDCFSRLATGGGFATRELYTDSEEILFDAMRPLVLTAISEIARREDLLDRCILLYLETIPPTERRDEKAIWAEFNALMPEILAGVFERLSTAIKNRDRLHLPQLPRMADFAKFIAESDPERASTFLKIYNTNKESANAVVLEANYLTDLIRKFLLREQHDQDIKATSDKCPAPKVIIWKNTATELLKTLDRFADDSLKREKFYIRHANALSAALRRLAPNLRMIGINIQFTRGTTHEAKRLISIESKRIVDTSDNIGGIDDKAKRSSASSAHEKYLDLLNPSAELTGLPFERTSGTNPVFDDLLTAHNKKVITNCVDINSAKTPLADDADDGNPHLTAADVESGICCSKHKIVLKQSINGNWVCTECELHDVREAFLEDIDSFLEDY